MIISLIIFIITAGFFSSYKISLWLSSCVLKLKRFVLIKSPSLLLSSLMKMLNFENGRKTFNVQSIKFNENKKKEKYKYTNTLSLGALRDICEDISCV